MRCALVFCLGLVLTIAGGAAGQSRLEKVLADREKFIQDDSWIYQDLAEAFAEAKETGRPLMVVMRCIPCEQCVKLDDDVIEEHAEIKPLLREFVRARVVSTNGLDLSTFQFDTDQSWVVFFLNADGTIYGRYGTRSDRTEWQDDVSVEGLAKAMQGALALHREFPGTKEALAAKRGPEPAFKTPEQYPSLKEKYKPRIEFGNNAVRNCIHCHQIGDAARLVYRQRGEEIPQQWLFPYPHPKSIGLILDPKERATVLRVEDDTPAAEAGFEKGDVIYRLQGQPLLSIADVQWVLHHAAGKGETLEAEVRRGDRVGTIKMQLAPGWKRRDDISWRVSSWPLRRMTTGGLVLEQLPADARRKLDLEDGEMALRVEHVGQYGPHAAAKRAGFQKGDIILAFDGRRDFLREGDWLTYAVNNTKPGDRVQVDVLRGEKRLKLSLPMQQ